MPQTDSVFGLVENDFQHSRYTAAMMKLVKLSNVYSKDLNFLNLLAKTQKALLDFSGLVKTIQAKAAITGAIADHIGCMNLLYSQGRLNEALDVALLLQESALNTVESKAVTYCLIKIYIEFTDYEGLQEVISAGNSESIDDVMLWASGLISLSNGDKNQALVFFRNAVLANSKNDQAWVSLALLHEEMGDRELALANLEKALDANPDNSLALKLMTKWYLRGVEQTQNMMKKIRHYLARYDFDEEISLCHMQMAKEANDQGTVSFEVEKLFLSDPVKYASIKKTSEDGIKNL